MVVPLGLPLLVDVGRRTSGAVPAAASLLIVALALDPPSQLAVLLTLPWLGVTLVLAGRAIDRGLIGRPTEAATILRTIAVLWLPLAALHITLSCADLSYGAIPPPLIELAGVHFTFAGFGATTLAASLVGASIGLRRHLAVAAGTVLTLGSATVGLGHLTVRPVELIGTTLVTIGVLGLAALGANALGPHTAGRVLLRISGLAVLGTDGVRARLQLGPRHRSRPPAL